MQVDTLTSIQARPPGFEHTAVIIPAYNEARFIGSVVLLARRYAATVIVVDDGSRDGTADLAESAGAQVIRHEVNSGKGVALKTAFQRARQLEGVLVIVTVDGVTTNRADMIASRRVNTSLINPG